MEAVYRAAYCLRNNNNCNSKRLEARVNDDTFKHREIFEIIKTISGTEEEMLTKLFSFKRKTTREDRVKNTIYDNTDRHPELERPLNEYNLIKSGRLYFKYVKGSWLEELRSIDGLELMWELESIGVLVPVKVQYRTTLGHMIGAPEIFVIMNRDPTDAEIEAAFHRVAKKRGTSKEELISKIRLRRI